MAETGARNRKRTLARKFEAVHKTTVTSRSSMPIVCRANFLTGTDVVAPSLRGFVSEMKESVEFRVASRLREARDETDITQSSAGNEDRDALITAAFDGFYKGRSLMTVTWTFSRLEVPPSSSCRCIPNEWTVFVYTISVAYAMW